MSAAHQGWGVPAPLGTAARGAGGPGVGTGGSEFHGGLLLLVDMNDIP